MAARDHRHRRPGEGGEQAARRDRYRQPPGVDVGDRSIELRADGLLTAEGVAQAGVDALPQPRARLATAPLLEGAALLLLRTKRANDLPHRGDLVRRERA